MKIIKLTKGYSTTVDNNDYDFLMQWKWCVKHPKKGAARVYAIRTVREHGKQKHRPMAHEIYERHKGQVLPGFIVDHLNGVYLDNRKRNLELTDFGDNVRRAQKGKMKSAK